MHQTERDILVLVVINERKSLQESHSLSRDEPLCWLVWPKRLGYLHSPFTIDDVDDTLSSFYSYSDKIKSDLIQLKTPDSIFRQ